MGEDMTYATEPTRAQLAARVAELEADWVDKNDVLMQSLQVMEAAEEFKQRAETAEVRVAKLERENAELRARLDAVPTTAFLKQAVGYIYEEDSEAIDAWIATLRPQALTAPDDDTDAPLKLAPVEDDE